MFPVGKGGARRAGDTDGNIYPTAIGETTLPKNETKAKANVSPSATP